MKIIITIDTEADDQWKQGAPISISNVYALGRFQTLAEKYGMTPTYLLTYEVAADARAAAQFREWQNAGRAEIGAHLHPWTTPPLEAGEERVNRFPSELPDDVLRAKFITLTEHITQAMGKRPTSYRAGRWGFDMRQAELLKEFGYCFDSSVTPGLSWAGTAGAPGGPGGPDFSYESVVPHKLNDSVLEVPMTILRSGLLFRKRWLRIFGNTTPGRLKSIIKSAQRKKLPAIVFMIHSSEFVVGKSPYVKTPEALAHVYECIEALFKLCKEYGIENAAASAFAKENL